MRLPRSKEDQPNSLSDGNKDIESQGTTTSNDSSSLDDTSTTQQPIDTIELTFSRFLEDITQKTSLSGGLRAYLSTKKNYHVHDIQSEHLGESRQYWRDIILGVNDGALQLGWIARTAANIDVLNLAALLHWYRSRLDVSLGRRRDGSEPFQHGHLADCYRGNHRWSYIHVVR